jgi:peptidoglycan-associated lipoprotein
MRGRRVVTWILCGSLWAGIVGCRKQPPPPPPPLPAPVEQPAAPEPPAPVVSLRAEPSSIDLGQEATLRWSSSNADTASLNQGIGTVETSGERVVSPASTTTYTISVRGAGGEATASTTVTVQPAAPPPPPAAKSGFREELAGRLRDAYFDFDKFDLRPDARDTLVSNAEALRELFREFSNTVVIEGHCDERGSAEYNLGLGDRRATAARELLLQLGLPADRLAAISYGKERPQCTESNEACWQLNRRAHFTASD